MEFFAHVASKVSFDFLVSRFKLQPRTSRSGVFFCPKKEPGHARLLLILTVMQKPASRKALAGRASRLAAASMAAEHDAD
ncbi:MAG: hypothetical protein A2516_08205 [Alphaproteobacteria bacterium RIFOXYD12_FULL_60_8]|nr:MAG: hypothetical protein A2516_08205 [Alphaproteobacteria bacterium RIFOXYD12_FULL_60_8]